jgi:hypothetical protein
MERFLDEQDSPAPSPSVHSLLSGDPKRQSRTPPPSSIDTDPITFDEARIISHHFEDLARHLDKEGLDFLGKLATSANAKPANGTSSSPTGESGLPGLGPILSHSASHPFTQ